MIAYPVNPPSQTVPHPFTLNDLRVHNVYEEEPEPTSSLALYGMAAVVILAIGTFVWVDPLHLFTSTAATPPASVSSIEAARPIERQEVAPPPDSATKSAEAPSTPAPVAQAPQGPAPVVRPRVAAAKPETRGTSTDKVHTAAHRPSPEETMTAPPVLLTNPDERATPPAAPAKTEERTEAQSVAPTVTPNAPPTVAPMVTPNVPKPADDTKSAPTTSPQSPSTE